MHRTTTTATLLVTVAVSALSGCVTLQRPAVPVPSAAPSRPPSQPAAPRPDERREPQIVQAPAREALELIGPSRGLEPTTATPHRQDASEPAPAHEPPGHRARSHPHPRPAHPEPGSPRLPRAKVPDVSKEVRKEAHKNVPKGTDMCGLGRKYGEWRADSPEATMCKQAYGR